MAWYDYVPVPSARIIKGVYDSFQPPDTTDLKNDTQAARDLRDLYSRQYLAASYDTRGAPQLTGNTRVDAQVAAGVPSVDAPTVEAAQLAGADQDQARRLQMNLLQKYNDVLSGYAPSVAQSQLDRNVAGVMGNQLGIAAQARGAERAGARRLAMINAGNAQAAAGLDAALLRANESATARSQIGQTLDSLRGQDVAFADRNAQLRQGAALSNAGMRLQADEGNAARGQALNLANANTINTVGAANVDRYQQQQQSNAGLRMDSRRLDDQRSESLRNATLGGISHTLDGDRTSLQTESANKERQTKFIGSVLNQAGGASTGAVTSGATAAASDKRVKHDVRPLNFDAAASKYLKESGSNTDDEMRAFLDSLHGYKFKYDNPSAPGQRAGQRFGVMAQELEQTPVGRSMVMDTPNGKMIDTGAGTGVLLAAMAKFNDELKRMQAGKKAVR